jgi:Domain of unknown function (DUF4124)
MDKRQVTLMQTARLLAVGAAVAWLSAGPAQAEVYKWVDKDGVTHYSDRPGPGAQEVQIPPAQTYQAPTVTLPPPPIATPPVASSTASRAVPCEVRSPADEEMLVNVPSVTIVFRGPELATPVLMVNNKRYTAEQGITKITISPLPRGTYELKLSFLDAQRNVVCTASPHKFHVRQPSVINRPNRPR